MRIPRAAAVVIDHGRVLVIKRYLRRESPCVMCEATGCVGAECPGHRYAVLPGGHVEAGETAEAAALRELTEETTLRATVSRLLWTGEHAGRPASYFLMADATGTPVLSGSEAEEHSAHNSFELLWATPDQFPALSLFPTSVRRPLTQLLNDA